MREATNEYLAYFDLSRFWPAVVKMVLIALAVFIPAMLISQALFPLTSLEPVLENDRVIYLAHYLVIICFVLFVLMVSSTTPIIIFTGLAVGGASSNYLEHLIFGPVDDYIPTINNFYINLADVAIGVGVLIGLASIIYNKFTYGYFVKITLIK